MAGGAGNTLNVTPWKKVERKVVISCDRQPSTPTIPDWAVTVSSLLPEDILNLEAFPPVAVWNVEVELECIELDNQDKNIIIEYRYLWDLGSLLNILSTATYY